jgi:hypothetical protein
MPTKWQKIKIQIPKGYKPAEREAIAQDVIDFIVERTRKGKDKNNKAFTPGYSKAYANSAEGRVAGKREGATPNLWLSGEMLTDLGDYLKHKNGEITIGFENGTESNAKADGNIRGTYGKPTPIKRGKYKRDFLGITERDLKKIIDTYPLDKEGVDIDMFRQILTERLSREMAETLTFEDI